MHVGPGHEISCDAIHIIDALNCGLEVVLKQWANAIPAAETWAMEHGFSEMASDTELANDISLQAHLSLGYREAERQICFAKRLR